MRTTDTLWSTIVSDGLENYLINNKVKLEVIEKSKQEISNSTEKLFLYYDEAETIEEVKVPVQKIVGVSRVQGYSWFDILHNTLRGSTDINMDQQRFLKQLSLLEDKGMIGLQEIYNNTRNIHFLGLRRDNEIQYFQIVDGNHRTVMSKILNLDFIHGSEVIYYDFNELKYSYYLQYQKAKKEFLKFIEETEFTVRGPFLGLYFEKYRMASKMWDRMPFDEYLFEINIDYIQEMVRNAEKYREEINKITILSVTYFNLYRVYPKILLRFMRFLNKLNLEPYKNTTVTLAKMIALKNILEYKKL